MGIALNRLVVISGNIGVGKTTLAKHLAADLGWHFEPESVDDNPYLTDFYRDMPNWALQLQLYFLGHRASRYLECLQSTRSAVFDRSIYDDANVFAAALYKSGHMKKRDYQNYCRLFDLISTRLRAPNMILYLRAPLRILIERIRRRNRPYEQQISEEYLKLVDEAYENWIPRVDFCPVIKVDCSKYDDLHDPNQTADIFQQAREMLSRHFDRKRAAR